MINDKILRQLSVLVIWGRIDMLDHRYGAGNWRAKWEDDYREYTRRLACGMGFYERAPLYAYAYRWKRP